MATKVQLGEMKRIEPRSVWDHEEQDFTPWLYEHLEKLGEALGFELEPLEREADVGDFAVDIVARELGTGRLVVIENQLAPTDHRHLGQLLTYAAGRDAGVVVWISPEFRDEHRETLDWLNRDGGQDRPEFYGVELQVLQIDKSNPAINLRPVAFPNRRREAPPRTISEKQERYQAFFQTLLDELRSDGFSNAKKGLPQNWYSFASGAKGYFYVASFPSGRRVRVELQMDRQRTPDGDTAFEKLLADKERIEADFGEPLSWERVEDQRSWRVAVYRDGSIEDPPELLAAHRTWMKQKLVQMEKVFGRRIA